MKTQNTFRKLIFLLCTFTILILTSCIENDQEDFNNSKKDQIIELNNLESNPEIHTKNYEEKLKALTFFRRSYERS